MSVWKIWFSPRKTAKKIACLEEEIGQLKSSLEEAEERCSAVKIKNEELSQVSNDLERETETLASRLDTLIRENKFFSQENEALKKKLQQYSDTTGRISEIEEALDKVEKMKAAYEERISRLRRMIMTMKKASVNDLSEANELLEIDMEEDEPIKVMRKEAKPENPDENWLEDLPY